MSPLDLLLRCFPFTATLCLSLASLGLAEVEPSDIPGTFDPDAVDRMIQGFGPIISSDEVPAGKAADHDTPDADADKGTPARPGPLSREFRDVLYADLERWVDAMKQGEPELRDAKLIALLLRLNPLHPLEQFPGDYAEALRLHHRALLGSPEALEQLARAFACGQMGALHFIADDTAAAFYRRRAAEALPAVP